MQINEHIREFHNEIPKTAKKTHRSRSQAYCFLCKEQVELVSTAQAAQLTAVTQHEIYQCAENGEVHRIHNSKGKIMICRSSLKLVQTGLHEAQTIILKPLEVFQ